MSEPYPTLSRVFYRADGGPAPLRVGLLIDSTRLPRVFRAMIRDLQQADFVDLVVAVENREEAAATPAPANPLARLLSSAETRRQFLYLLYEKLDNRRHASPLEPTASVECADLLEDVPRLAVLPLRSRHVHRFPEDSLASLRALNLDVLIRFGFNILKGDVLTCARYGIWSFHHGDGDSYRGTPPHLWEVIEGNPVSGVILQRLTEKLDDGLVLAKGVYKTSSAVSAAKNRYGPYWCSAHLLIQKLRQLHDHGWPAVERDALAPAPYRGRRPLYRTPGNLEMVGWGLRTLVPAALRKLRNRGRGTQWRIGLRRQGDPLYRGADPTVVREFTWTTAPRGRFWADPFLIEEAGIRWVFFEDYDHATGKGTIWCAKAGDDGTLREPRLVLEQPFHLSYPSLIRHRGEIYMIPESEAAGRVDLYRARNFPHDWVLERTLLDIRAVDSTAFEYDGKWWLFTTAMPVEHHASATLLYMAEDLAGPWRLHPASPIASDVRHARSAGQVIRDGKRLVRATMDCSVTYGYALRFREIQALDESTYREATIAEVLPGGLRGQIGIHTFNRLGDWEVIDACFDVAGTELSPAT